MEVWLCAGIAQNYLMLWRKRGTIFKTGAEAGFKMRVMGNESREGSGVFVAIGAKTYHPEVIPMELASGTGGQKREGGDGVRLRNSKGQWKWLER